MADQFVCEMVVTVTTLPLHTCRMLSHPFRESPLLRMLDHTVHRRNVLDAMFFQVLLHTSAKNEDCDCCEYNINVLHIEEVVVTLISQNREK